MESSPASPRALTAADLNVTINHEPRISADRLAEVLGFARGRAINDLIERNMAALERFGEVCRTVRQTSAKGGRPGKTYWPNKRQALYLCTKSEAPFATEIVIEMVTVFDAHLTAKAMPAPKRSLPKPALAQPLPPQPKKFEPGSDILKDLSCAVIAANRAVASGREKSFGEALEKVLGAIDSQRSDESFNSGLMLYDWNWIRNTATRSKLKAV